VHDVSERIELHTIVDRCGQMDAGQSQQPWQRIDLDGLIIVTDQQPRSSQVLGYAKRVVD